MRNLLFPLNTLAKSRGEVVLQEWGWRSIAQGASLTPTIVVICHCSLSTSEIILLRSFPICRYANCFFCGYLRLLRYFMEKESYKASIWTITVAHLIGGGISAFSTCTKSWAK